jgi:hypothetical protein
MRHQELPVLIRWAGPLVSPAHYACTMHTLANDNNFDIFEGTQPCPFENAVLCHGSNELVLRCSQKEMRSRREEHVFHMLRSAYKNDTMKREEPQRCTRTRDKEHAMIDFFHKTVSLHCSKQQSGLVPGGYIVLPCLLSLSRKF